MALLDSEGFGWTTNLSDLTAYGGWISSSGIGGGIIPNGPLGDNYMNLTFSYSGGQVWMGRNVVTSGSTVYFGIRWNPGEIGNDTPFLTLTDAIGNSQISIQSTVTGAIAVYRGSATSYTGTGTLLGTSASGVIGTSWQYVECSAVISSTAGSVVVRVNNVVVLSLSNVNTEGGTSTSISQFRISCNSITNVNALFSHFYLCDNTGSAPSNTFLGDVRVQTLLPTANSSVAFTPSNTAVTVQDYPVGTSAAGSVATGTLEWRRITNTTPGVVTALQYALSASATGNMLLALYADNGSGTAPTGAALCSGVITNPAAGTVSATISSGPTLANGAYYWLLTSASVATAGYQNSSSTAEPACTASAAYSATPPSASAVTLTTNTSTSWKAVVVTPNETNYQIAANTPAATTVGNNSSTVGAEDLFTMSQPASSSTIVFGVVSKIIASKTDSGTRTVSAVVKSGSTTSAGAAFSPSTSALQFKTIYAVDPNTSAQWTVSAVQAMTVGYEIAS